MDIKELKKRILEKINYDYYKCNTYENDNLIFIELFTGISKANKYCFITVIKNDYKIFKIKGEITIHEINDINKILADFKAI